MRCTACGSEDPGGKRFCGDCGVLLAAPLIDAPVEEERRHLTVLFSDLVGSTEIAARLDPEEWRDVLARYHRAAADAVESLGGYVAQYLGDGLLIYFGWPIAHEDDALRAVRAGLAIIDAVEQLNLRFVSERLAVRIGAESGSVVVGRDGGGDPTVYGDTPHIAARAQALATPGTVVITDALQELVAGQFLFEDLGVPALKGVDRAIRLFRVIGPRAARGRDRRDIPLVGREDEMRRLLSRWDEARRGLGQLVVVTGEPGIGKSHLIAAFHGRILRQDHLWVEFVGERFFENTPFHVVVNLLDRVLRDPAADAPTDRLRRLGELLRRDGLTGDEPVATVGEMLGLPVSSVSGEPITAERRRRRLLETLTAWALRVATRKPVILVLEDLHWVDPSTLELTRLLVEAAIGAPMLLLATTRGGQTLPWTMRAHCLEMPLSRLSDAQTRELVASVASRNAVEAGLIEAVVARADGVPLFAEALTRLMIDGAVRPLGGAIPATLHDSLTARLDGMGPAREVIRVAAVLGREFPYRLIQAVAERPERELREGLAALIRADLIVERGSPPDATYRFEHALIQDAAYEGLLKSRRRDLHRRAAIALTQLFPAVAAAQPQIVARHWTLAGEAESALATWKTAGDLALSRRAFREAEEAYFQALGALSVLAPSGDRDRREYAVCALLVVVRQQTRGYSAPETIAASDRARALAAVVGDTAEQLRQEVRAWNALFVSGDYAAAAALAKQMAELTRGTLLDARRRAFTLHEAVQARFYTGDLNGVETQFAYLEPLLRTDDPYRTSGDVVISMGVPALGALAAGRIKLAWERMARARAYAEESRDSYALVLILLFESYLHRFQNAPAPAAAAAARMLSVAEDNAFAYATDLARGVLGWARAAGGRPDEGVVLVRQALKGQMAAGALVGVTDVLNRLAEAQWLAGDVGGALDSVEQALAINPQERIFRPNGLMIRGGLRQDLGEAALALADYHAAIDMALEMGALAWALKGAVAFARLTSALGDEDAARACLTRVCDAVPDDCDTAERPEARALLASLRG